MELREPEPEVLRGSGRPAVQEHVGAAREIEEPIPVGRLGEVQDDAALPPAVHRRGRRILVPQGSPVRWFHPHDIGPVVGEEPGGPLAGGQIRAIEDP